MITVYTERKVWELNDKFYGMGLEWTVHLSDQAISIWEHTHVCMGGVEWRPMCSYSQIK